MDISIKQVCAEIELFAPLSLQESYDNAGLIIGNPAHQISGVLIALDCTEKVIEEAILKKCNLIVCHHPLIFQGLKKITGKNYVERAVILAIKNDIAIYAAHTNLDNVMQGVNAEMAKKIGLQNLEILQPIAGKLFKLVVFCPVAHTEKVKNAIFSAGAGNIGNYSECSFTSSGIGTFKGMEGSNPFAGKPYERHLEPEDRIEIVFPTYLKDKVLKILLEAHPYEEVAYDLIPISNANAATGAGMIGELKEEQPEMAFLQRMKTIFNAKGIRYTNLRNKPIKKVAICGGSGSFLLENAVNAGADIFITGDYKYHQFFDADGRIVIADIGHFESEQFTQDLFYNIITKKFTTFAVHLTKTSTNPINYL